MFCIAAFIVFAILAIFSASFRPLAAKAWHCVLRRITFRPCDISFGEEMKGKLISKLVFTHPRLARHVDRWLELLSFLFVVLSVWSLLYAANAGLNLWVYDTCNPRSGESCSLSGEACGIDQETLTFVNALSSQRLGEWLIGPMQRFRETVSRIPDRLREWDAREFLPEMATYSKPEDPQKPYVLEIIDPGCRYCKKLTKNLEEVGVMDAANVTYILYPIYDTSAGGYKFAHSYLVASYLEAVKRVPLRTSVDGMPPDWRLLKALFADPLSESDLQARINIGMTADDVETLLQGMLRDIGYNETGISSIKLLSVSSDVEESLAHQRSIVEERIRTIKIPTLLFDGRRFDRVVSVEALRKRL